MFYAKALYRDVFSSLPFSRLIMFLPFTIHLSKFVAQLSEAFVDAQSGEEWRCLIKYGAAKFEPRRQVAAL
jgi:hypothetical protein